MRLATVALALVGVVGMVPGAVAAESDRLLFTDTLSLSAINADGSGREAIRDLRNVSCTAHFAVTHCPAFARWSPDGSLVAFVERDRLYLWRYATRETDLVYTEVPAGTFWVAWSPDSTRVAFVSASYNTPNFPPELWVHRVDGDRSTTRITTDGWVAGRPAWSPEGDWIAYPGRLGANSGHVELFVVAADGSSRRQLTQGPGTDSYTRDPAWSPSGDRIAFSWGNPLSRPNDLYVIDRDGTGLRKVDYAPASPLYPTWTRDGERILVSAYAFEPVWIGEPNHPTGAGIWSVAADGSGSVRLTEGHQIFDHTPDVSPGGNRIAFIRGETQYDNVTERHGVYVANADGTCERRVVHVTPLAGVHWRPRPGATDELTRCVDLVATPRKVRYGSGERTIQMALVNDGTEELRFIRLSVFAGVRSTRFAGRGEGLSCGYAGGQFYCDMPRLAPGERRNVEIDVNPLVAHRNSTTPIQVTLGAQAGATEDDLSANRFTVTVSPIDCEPGLPDDGIWRIGGTSSGDRICGRVGPDLIKAGKGHDVVDADKGDDIVDGGDGNDVLVGGPGNDKLIGQGGRDVLSGREGNDRLLARDRARDRISCGRGRDLVVADRRDRVARDCERVVRR